MDTKKLFTTLIIGLVIGLAAGYPLSRLTQPVKTATTTKTHVVVVKIQNGISLAELVKHFGRAVGASQQAAAQNNWITCIVYRDRATTASTARAGDWTLSLCAKVR